MCLLELYSCTMILISGWKDYCYVFTLGCWSRIKYLFYVRGFKLFFLKVKRCISDVG